MKLIGWDSLPALLPVGILGVLQYYKQGHVDFKVVGILAVGFLLGSYFGSKVALSLSQEAVKKIFAVLMIVIAIKMLFFDKPKKEGADNKQSFIQTPLNNNEIV